MNVKKFSWLLNEARLGKNDRRWFPRWLRRYAATVPMVGGELPVTGADVIKFSQSLRDNGTPAWQRLQAVRAVEAYRNLVLKTEEPSLADMRQTLGRLADQERALGTGGGRPGVQDERHLIGRIDPREPAIVQQMRKELRLRHKAMRTERSYVGWVRRFIGHCQSEDLQDFGEPQIKSFLTELAVEGNVTSGTQNQAKCAFELQCAVIIVGLDSSSRWRSRCMARTSRRTGIALPHRGLQLLQKNTYPR